MVILAILGMLSGSGDSDSQTAPGAAEAPKAPATVEKMCKDVLGRIVGSGSV